MYKGKDLRLLQREYSDDCWKITGMGYQLYPDEFCWKPDADQEFLADAAAEAVESHINKALKLRGKRKVEVSITDNGAYGHVMDIENDQEDNYDLMSRVEDYLRSDDGCSDTQDAFNEAYTDELTDMGFFFHGEKEDYDHILEMGYVLEDDYNVVKIADATAEQLSDHIAHTSDPDKNQRQYLFNIVKAEA